MRRRKAQLPVPAANADLPSCTGAVVVLCMVTGLGSVGNCFCVKASMPAEPALLTYDGLHAARTANRFVSVKSLRSTHLRNIAIRKLKQTATEERGNMRSELFRRLWRNLKALQGIP